MGKLISSIRGQLIATFLLLTLLLTVLIGAAAYYASFKTVSSRVGESFSLALEYVTSAVDGEVKHVMQLSDYLFVSNQVKEALINIPLSRELFYQYDSQVYKILNEYALSHVIGSLNHIAIDSMDGHTMRYQFKYYDINANAMFPIDPAMAALALNTPGRAVWSPISARVVNPGGAHPLPIRDITLYRAIKDRTYRENIGVMRISVAPETFSSLKKDYEEKYPNFAGQCEILLLDGQMACLDAQGSLLLDADQLKEAARSDEARALYGWAMPGSDYVVYARTVDKCGWTLLGILPKALLQSDNGYLFRMSLVGCVLSILVCALIYLLLSSRIVRPMVEISGALKKIEAGDPDVRLNARRPDEMGALCDNINSMLDRTQELHQLAMEHQRKLQEAQYQAFQAQINPHFVCNTLNAIRWMARMAGADNIKAAVDAFWHITRYAADTRRALVTVGEEVSIVGKYVYLQELAHPDRFCVLWDVQGGVADAQCVKFFLQPVVENAIVHGALGEGGRVEIYVSAYAEAGELVFNVYDNGAGMAPDRVRQVLSGDLPGHVGLQNVLERLSLVYGDRGKVDISSEPGRYTNVMIRTPLEYGLGGELLCP